ncbi:hypothetical protein TNCV_816031 [Trichonephila clavipes]|nr:hypothetical protein TNCV_816031 [Trichonephila clavipes]
MRARTYCGHSSIRDHWVLRCISRYPDQVISLKRDRPPVFKSSSKFGTSFIDLLHADRSLFWPIEAYLLAGHRRSTGALGTGGSKFMTRKSGQVQLIRTLVGSCPKRPMDKPALSTPKVSNSKANLG